MTWYSSKDVAYLFVNSVNVAGVISSARLKTNALLVDTTCLGDTWREMSDTGLRSGELELTGVYDGIYAQTWDVEAASNITSLCLEGNTVSKRFYGWQAAQVTSTEVAVSSDDVHRQTGEFTVKGEVNFGYVVAPYAARTTDGNTQSTYADMGASGSTGHAFLHCAGCTPGGGNGVTVTVQHSTDHVVWVDHTSFTKFSSAYYQVIALATTVNQYLAIKWVWDGGTGQSFSAFVGVAVD